MPKKNPQVDAYIEKAQPFAKPILKHLRALVHKACPECEEVMKWSFPHFDYKGMLCSMASFKAHCAFGFWKAKLLKDAESVLQKTDREAMGHCGRITSLKDLPSDKAIIGLVKEAVKLNDDGVKIVRAVKPKAALKTPAYFMEAVRKNKKALTTFEAFSPSCKREYVEWVTDAKQEATRDKRLTTAVKWLAEGKQRHWKYQNC